KWQAAQSALRMTLFRLRAAGRTMLVHRWRAQVDGFAQRLGDLSPDRVLARGYSRTVLERTGATLTRAADARPGDRLRTHLAQGELASKVEQVSQRRMSNDEQGTAKGEGSSQTAGRATRRRKDAPGPPQRTLFE
ncbi:MAG: exodeoxyribonuclease VII large subunit, partial [Phycisphaerae bacterium]